MDITDRFAETVKYKGDLVVCQFLLLVHELKQRPIGSILKDQVDDIVLVDSAVESDDVGVIERTLYLYFLLDILQFLRFELSPVYLRITKKYLSD